MTTTYGLTGVPRVPTMLSAQGPTAGRRRRAFGVLLVSGTLLAAAFGVVPAGAVDELPAKVVVIRPPVSSAVYSGVDYGRSTSTKDDRSTTTTWRVVQNTGNCCESYVTTTPGGRLLNFGGSYIAYSDDRGQTWREVQPLTPLVAGEGAIVAAPGGDVLGVAWDLNAGGQLQFFKYEADTKQWLYTQLTPHDPYYDREWIGVVPGPVTVGGKTYDYVSFVKGGAPSKDVWYYSTDGLNYLEVSSPTADQMLGQGAVRAPLRTLANPVLDWVQPNTNSGMTTLGGGGMLAAPDWLASVLGAGTYALLDPKTLSWSSYALPDGKRPEDSYQVDSAGRTHNVVPTADRKAFDYRVSRDGGKSWRSVRVALPPSHTMEEYGGRRQWDFRANLAAGVAAVAIRARHAKGTDQDLVYKLDITGDAPRLSRLLRVGRGDIYAGNGTAESTVARMDFGSVSIFRDGRVAVSFLDSTTKYECCSPASLGRAGVSPAIAIETETNFVVPVR